MKKNLIKYKKGIRSKIKFIIKRVTKENSNWIELFQGESGSGKTWSAISQANYIDPTFDVQKQLVFSFRDFMKVINSEEFRKRKWKILIFDEPQTQISSREWQKLVNKLFNYVLTTFRHQNIILMFCCPYRDFLDSNSMKMVHCITEMVSIIKKVNKVKTKPKLQQYNSKLKKTYEHCIYVLKDGKAEKMIYDFVPKPPIELVKTYEAMKTEFTTTLNKDVERQLDKLERFGEDEKPAKELTEKQKRAIDLMEEHKDMKKVAEIMQISLKNAYGHLVRAKIKGYRPIMPPPSA